MIKHYLLVLACCLSLVASSQMTSEQRAALRREEDRYTKPITEAFDNRTFTLTVNTRHPEGFYFNSYFKVKFLAATYTSPDLFLQWEEAIGSDRTGDLQITRKEAWIKINYISKYLPLAMTFQPNSAYDAKQMYAAIQFNSDNNNYIQIWETKFDVNNGTKNQVSSQGKKVNEVYVPFMSLGDCSTCYTPEQVTRVIRYLSDFYKYYNDEE